VIPPDARRQEAPPQTPVPDWESEKVATLVLTCELHSTSVLYLTYELQSTSILCLTYELQTTSILGRTSTVLEAVLRSRALQCFARCTLVVRSYSIVCIFLVIENAFNVSLNLLCTFSSLEATYNCVWKKTADTF